MLFYTLMEMGIVCVTETLSMGKQEIII